jgi:hypothetical protein
VKGYGKAVRDKLAEAGCLFVRHGRGDHDIWVNPVSGQNLTAGENHVQASGQQGAQGRRAAEGVLTFRRAIAIGHGRQ